MLRSRPSRTFAAFFACSAFVVAFAQTAPRPLTHADYDTWRSINTPQLSRDGKWLAYSFMPQDADGDLLLREIATGREHRVPVGAYPSAPAAATDESASPEEAPPPRNVRIAFTGDSRYAIATTHPAKAEVAAARAAKKKPEEMPNGGLVIVRLDTGDVTRVADVKSFQVAAKGGAWLAYLKEPKPEDRKAAEGEKSGETDANDTSNDESDDDSRDDAGGQDEADAAAPRRAASGSAATGAGGGNFGTELVVRDLDGASESTFAWVTSYSMARDGKTLLYAVSAKTPSNNGVYAFTPGDTADPKPLLSGRGRYSRLAWDREQTQAVFVSDHDAAAMAGTSSRTGARNKLYLWPRTAEAATAIVSNTTRGVPEKFAISSSASASFSRDGRKIYVPTAPVSASSSRGASSSGGSAASPDPEKVTADLWHWKDGFIQPMQKSGATRERNRTYRGVFDLATKEYAQLADPTMATVTLSDDGTRALGTDDRAYRPLVDFDGRYADVYLVNASTGERKLALKQLRSEGGRGLLWSPDGKWAAYYRDRQWHVLDTATGATRSLTAKLRVAFHDELDDHPQPPRAHGSAGWTKDSASLLVYDRFDVWQVFPNDQPAKNLTAGQGRAARIQYRVQRIEAIDEDDDERGIDPAATLVLRGESEETRATGFFRTTFAATKAPEQLVWGDKNYRYVGRAREADALLVTASRFDEFPDVHVTDSSFATLKKMTDGGAQLAPFKWGRAELMSFRNAEGAQLKATLYKPADFDPAKKYPLMVFIYERLSQNVHAFIPPSPFSGLNVAPSINASFYVSNGYCVLMPDIVYKIGAPGQSALRCVLPVLDAVIARGFIDPKAVGIQGHSWGGYQIAYMVTQTDRFRAAEAGAPVGNMTSAYSGIRWGSGLPRQFQYETGQSRIGQPLQKAVPLFLANSPVFHAERVKTPLLILANDQDDAVPWYQGIELFLALRRQGKPAWLLNYNGEPHSVRRRPNQKDWTKRMQQFFDHYLKGSPAPKWLEEGIPYIERDEEKQKFNAPPKSEGSEPVAAASTQ